LDTVFTYLPVLCLTISIELPVAWFFLRHQQRRRVVLAAIVGNCITHPALHFLLPLVLSPEDKGLFLLVGELLVLAVEIIVYRTIVPKTSWALAIATAAAANALSYGIGVVFF